MISSASTPSFSRLLVTGLVMSVMICAVPFSADAQTTKTKKTVNKTCIQTAVDVREAAVMISFTDFNGQIVAALTERKAALNTAWGLTDTAARRVAIKKAWSDWKADRKAANTELKTEKLAAWATFKETAKTSCKVEVPKEDSLEKETAGSLTL
jgi:hypothetical protein